jgi:hypothetical protein
LSSIILPQSTLFVTQRYRSVMTIDMIAKTTWSWHNSAIMKKPLQDVIGSGLFAMSALVLSGCNSPSSSPPTSSSPSSSTAASQPEKAAAVTTTDDTPAPQRKPPAGQGNAIGRVLFDGKGAPNIEVQLCETIGLVGGCSGQTYAGKTNKDGFYIIDKVKPGAYALAVRVFNTDKFLYPTVGIMSAAKFNVEKDESFAVQAVNLWKTDLQIQSPKNGSTVQSDKPKLTWKAYPNAANYKVSVRTRQGVGALATIETSEPSAVPEKPLLNGEYQWRVEAANAEGTKIAETDRDAVFKVAGQAGSNTVDIVNPKPKSTVSGSGLTLQWKAHPLATEYRIYLKGVKAKESILSFESMNGTSYKLPNVLPADQYFWSVEAYKDGEKIAGSPLQTFKTT